MLLKLVEHGMLNASFYVEPAKINPGFASLYTIVEYRSFKDCPDNRDIEAEVHLNKNATDAQTNK